MQNFQGIAFVWTQTYSEGDFQMCYYTEKKQTGGVVDILFWDPLCGSGIFHFLFQP